MSQSSFSFAVSSTEARFTNALLVRDVDGQYRVASADEVLSQAWGVLAERVKPGVTLSSPQDVKDYLRLAIGMLEHEVFCVVFLDAQHRVIELQQMFRGTVTQTSVYPREVVKASLALNAAAVILAHNHPSGAAEPSPCRRVPDADAEDRAATGRRARARSPGGHRERSGQFRGMWTPLIWEVREPRWLLQALRRR